MCTRSMAIPNHSITLQLKEIPLPVGMMAWLSDKNRYLVIAVFNHCSFWLRELNMVCEEYMVW